MTTWQISSRVAAIGLSGLVVLDIALVGTALRSTHVTGIDTSPVSTDSAPINPADSTGSAVSPSSTPPVTRAPLRTVLVALDNLRAWRASAGSCSAGGAALAVTADGGRTWVEGKVPLRRIVRVRLESAQAAFVVGAGSTCGAELRDTTDGGRTWTSAGDVGSSWFRDPKDPGVVRAPGPSTSQPCGKGAVLDLAVVASESAQVLCADGRVLSTVNTGGTWTDVGTVGGAVALAVPAAKPAETYVARLDAPDCAGVQIVRVRPRAVASCAQAAIPKEPGQVALSLTESGGWLAVGETTVRSTDNLRRWSVS